MSENFVFQKDKGEPAAKEKLERLVGLEKRMDRLETAISTLTERLESLMPHDDPVADFGGELTAAAAPEKKSKK